MSRLLILNTGSSSVKFRVFDTQPTLPLIAGGKVVDIGTTPTFSAQLEGGNPVSESLPATASHEDALAHILNWLEQNEIPATRLKGVGHRIVHGGAHFATPVRLTDSIMQELRSLIALAPLHQPHNLAGVDILAAQQPQLAQYACFDTAFHAGHSELHASFALPASIRAQGIRRYGFHGLSYDWVVHALRREQPDLLAGRVVVAHLGNGASLCAMRNGVSLDTTMGMTALDGLPMGTRCGALDAGVVIHMLRTLKLSADEVEQILYNESGLKGLSGISNDVKTLSQSSDPQAAFALDYFSHKTAQHIASMAVSLGGMDALVFTGGIGENAANIRSSIIERLSFLPPFTTHIVAANEERSMAQELIEQFAQDFSGDIA